MRSVNVNPIIKLIFLCLILSACKKDAPSPDNPKLIFKFKFDPDQDRLGNFGLPQSIPQTNAAQTPTFKVIGLLKQMV